MSKEPVETKTIYRDVIPKAEMALEASQSGKKGYGPTLKR